MSMQLVLRLTKVLILCESQYFCIMSSEPPFVINPVRPMNVLIKNLERNIKLTYFTLIEKNNLDLSKTQFVKGCNENYYIYISASGSNPPGVVVAYRDI